MTDIEAGLIAALKRLANRTPEDADYAIIGKISLNATSLEYQIEDLIWYYMGSVDLGHVATAQLGSQQKTDMLATLVEWAEPDDGVADAIAYIIKAFHILRVNRNTIVHGFNFKADKKAGKLFIERRTKSIIFDEFQVFDLDRTALIEVENGQRRLATFIWKTSSIIKDRPPETITAPPPAELEPLELLPIPSLPNGLRPLDFEPAKSSRRQRQEQLANERREAMRGRRGKKRPGRV